MKCKRPLYKETKKETHKHTVDDRSHAHTSMYPNLQDYSHEHAETMDSYDPIYLMPCKSSWMD